MFSDACVDILRLSEGEYLRILGELRQHELRGATAEARSETRYRYSLRRALVLQVADAPVRFWVRPRNISKGGISVLHGCFLYPDTPCIATLVTIDGESVLAPGIVVHCRCVHGRVHEVALKFAQPIDVSNFVRPGTQAEALALQANGAADCRYPSADVMKLAADVQELAANGAPPERLTELLAELRDLLTEPAAEESPVAGG